MLHSFSPYTHTLVGSWSKQLTQNLSECKQYSHIFLSWLIGLCGLRFPCRQWWQQLWSSKQEKHLTLRSMKHQNIYFRAAINKLFYHWDVSCNPADYIFNSQVKDNLNNLSPTWENNFQCLKPLTSGLQFQALIVTFSINGKNENSDW